MSEKPKRFDLGRPMKSEAPKALKQIRAPESKEDELRMSIRDWVTFLRQDGSYGVPRALWSVARFFIRPVPSGDRMRRMLHPQLYPWLRDTCNLEGIQTVGDLVVVFQHAGKANVNEEPWIWFGSQGTTVSLTKNILRRRGLLD